MAENWLFLKGARYGLRLDPGTGNPSSFRARIGADLIYPEWQALQLPHAGEFLPPANDLTEPKDKIDEYLLGLKKQYR